MQIKASVGVQVLYLRRLCDQPTLGAEVRVSMLETEQGLRNGPLQPHFTGLAYPQTPVTWRSLSAFCPAGVARCPT